MDSDIILANARRSDEDSSAAFERATANEGLRRRFPQEADDGQREFTLPPADGGRSAWLFLAGCFAVEALMWGFPFAFGVFQEYYTTHEPFSSKPSGIAAIGTTSTGIMYLSCPIWFAAFKRWPHIRQKCAVTGLLINAVAIAAASFATEVSHLILTQGVLYAIGGVMVYCPTCAFLDEWFIRRKGLAFGVMWAGTGVAGVVLPFVMSSMLSAYGFRTTLRAYAIALILLALPLLYFVKPRIPVSQTSLHRRLDPKFLVSTTFWIPQLCNIVQGLGYFIPSIYLPSYTKSLGMTQTEGTLMVALVNVGVALGAVWVGALIDRIHVSTVMAVCSLGAGLAVFLLWGLGLSLPLLSVFSLLYGLTAGGFSSNYTGIVQDVKEKVVGADSGMIFGFLAAGRGIGAVVSGPLSEALFELKTWKGDAKLGYGTGYGLLIVFTGVTTVTGGGNWAARRLGWL